MTGILMGIFFVIYWDMVLEYEWTDYGIHPLVIKRGWKIPYQ